MKLFCICIYRDINEDGYVRATDAFIIHDVSNVGTKSEGNLEGTFSNYAKLYLPVILLSRKQF